MERETGIEPATSTLARWRSTAELFPLGEAKDSRRAGRGSTGAGRAKELRKTFVLLALYP
jgi:hypothetical protein